MSLLLLAPVFLLGLLFSLAMLAFFIFVLIDCAKNEPSDGNTKIVWILIIIFTAPVGGIIYYLVRRPERIASQGF